MFLVVLLHFSSGQNGALHAKDRLFKELASKLKEKKLNFPTGTAASTGKYITQTICNALWYITNSHKVIKTAARKRENVKPVPDEFSRYVNLNDVHNKKSSCFAEPKGT